MNMISSSSSTTAYARARRRKGFRFWVGRVLLGLRALLVGLVALGASYRAIATARDQGSYPPPGRLIDVGGYRRWSRPYALASHWRRRQTNFHIPRRVKSPAARIAGRDAHPR